MLTECGLCGIYGGGVLCVHGAHCCILRAYQKLVVCEESGQGNVSCAWHECFYLSNKITRLNCGDSHVGGCT